MRGIVFLGNRKLEIQEFPDPTPGPGEVVLEMKASGMCGSDLHPYRAAGNAAAALGLGAGGPVIAGHEPCGVVAAVGAGVDPSLVGQGAVGLSATMLGRAMGARVIAIDVVPERLALAREFGAEHVVNAKDADPVKAIHDLTRGEGAETTMDCSGSSEGRLGALQSAGTWGRVAFVGEGGQTTIDVSKHMLRRQLTVHASWTFSTVGQAECARFVANRKIPLKRLLTHRFRLEQADDAYRLFDTQTTGKGVFVF